MVENVRLRHSLLFQLCYSVRWMQNLQLFLSYSEDNISFPNLFINNKNIIHSTWTHFLKPNLWMVLDICSYSCQGPIYLWDCLYLHSFPSSVNKYGFWLTNWREASPRESWLSFTCAASLIFFACWKTEMTLIWTQWQLVFYSRQLFTAVKKVKYFTSVNCCQVHVSI